MRRFYQEYIEDEVFVLPEEESKHMIKVLRMREGETFELVNGQGVLAQAEIRVAHPKKCEVAVLTRQSSKQSRPVFHLAIAPTKNLDRMEWLVEKATELGLGRISFINCQNNERRQLKTDRIQKIAISAMKQSKSLFLPIIDELQDFKSFIASYPTGYIAHCYSTPKSDFYPAIVHTDSPILIGPEGDFSPEEVEYAEKNGYISVDLGHTRLRTETAGIYACALIKLKIETV
jgi:16S rRNA (uracil1498-N3)-methyltransferase